MNRHILGLLAILLLSRAAGAAPPFACTPPANTPSGLALTCVCDTFGRSSLNPSSIFGQDWIVSTSDNTSINPRIVVPGYLRLTENTGNNAKAATVPGVFPAAGNYISVEFQHFAYRGNGADGIAVILSDYSVPAVPGAFGGSLGYAQKSNPGSDCTKAGGCPGFAGGWIGVALDEFGNYQSASEGRIGGPRFIPDSVAVRGSGSGMSGYRWLAGTNSLAPAVDNPWSYPPAPGAYYQVIVDARNDPASTRVSVNRDTAGNGGYSSLFELPNVYDAARAQGFTQAPVPAYWQVSFTGSTGGLNNIHEISGLRICAQTILPRTGGTASNFNAIDSAYGAPPLAVQNYQTGHINMKLAGVPFSLNVAAIRDNRIQADYVVFGTKQVSVKLVDNTDGACVIDNTKPNYCNATCTGKAAIPGGSQTLSFAAADKGQKRSADFTINTAYRNLVAIISDASATACSTDAFSVRPLGMTVASIATPADAGNAAINLANSGTPKFKAGSGQFALTASTQGTRKGGVDYPSGYNGVSKIDNAGLLAVRIDNDGLRAPSPALVAGTVAGTFAAAIPGTPSSTATGIAFTYSEVGHFRLLGYSPASDATSPRGVFDGVNVARECTAAGLAVGACDALKLATWTGVDSVSTRNDCLADSYANTLSGGKYGCNFGLTASADFGRFIPDHFTLEAPALLNRAGTAGGATSSFTYMDEPMSASFVLSARNGMGSVTRNYTGALARLDLARAAAIGFGALDNGSTKTPLSERLAVSDLNGAWPADPSAPHAGNGVATVTATLTLPRQAAPDGPYENLDIGAAPEDADGVTLLPASLNRDMDNDGADDSQLVGSTRSRFGRLRLGNAYGPALLPLRLPLALQYWNGSTFVANHEDSLTGLASNRVSLGNFRKNLQVGETCRRLDGSVAAASPCPDTSLTFNRGQGTVILTAPGAANNGSVDVAIDLGVAGLGHLQGDWQGAAFDDNPSARATFGLHQRSRAVIYMRENY